MDYQKQAQDFAKKHGIKLTVLSKEYKRHFASDKESRWVFHLNLQRNGKSYTFDFGQSMADGDTEPTMYDVLACLTKYDVGSFDDFCSEFGYNELPLSAYKATKKLYKAVCKEFEAVERLFGDVIEELQEIS
jgi:hypothetical protein